MRKWGYLINRQDPNYQQKFKSISSQEQNYFLHFALRYPVGQIQSFIGNFLSHRYSMIRMVVNIGSIVQWQSPRVVVLQKQCHIKTGLSSISTNNCAVGKRNKSLLYCVLLSGEMSQKKMPAKAGALRAELRSFLSSQFL